MLGTMLTLNCQLAIVELPRWAATSLETSPELATSPRHQSAEAEAVLDLALDFGDGLAALVARAPSSEVHR